MSAGAERRVWPLLASHKEEKWTWGARGLCRRTAKVWRARKMDNETKKKMAKKRQQGQGRVSVTLGVRRREISALQG